jgi:hypothetical protein
VLPNIDLHCYGIVAFSSAGHRVGRMNARIVFVVSLWVAPFFRPALQAAELRIAPGSFRSGKAYLSCTFDGVKETCLLDTGSAMTLLTNTARWSSYPNLGEFHFKSAASVSETAETIQIRTAIIDQVEFSNIKIGRLPEVPEVPEAPEREAIANSIGMDLLARQPFSMQFLQSPGLHLKPKAPRRILPELGVNRYNLLSLPISLNGSQMGALWDTGFGVTAVDLSFVQAHPEDFRSSRDFMRGTDGTGHELVLKSFRAKKITIGSRSFRNVKIVAVDLSLLRENLDPNVHAVIGFNIIRRADWFFDPAKKVWSIE